MAGGQLFFDGFRLDPIAGELWRDGVVVALEPRVFALLHYFVENPQRALSKRELLDAVWPGLFVTEAVLKVAVQKLRRALGDRATAPRWIETLHRRGYRFKGPVEGARLPAPTTRFIGRDRDLAEIGRRLAETRLLTLTGAGGAGKTRLAERAAGAEAPAFADGAWWVDLAPLADPERVPQAVAAVFGVRDQPGRPLAAALADALRPRRLLLVLDNCEHLVAACAELAERLLAAAPGLHLLATSREPLGAAGEQVWPVPPLGLPPPGAAARDEMLAAEAVRLFVDRAHAIEPAFAVTTETAPGLARLCRRLDGMPLAIELAAARVQVLTLEQIEERLDDALSLLTGGRRTALPRHQTLRATIEWSYELLTADERRLLDRLGVFAGGFDLAAAEAVCAGSEPPPAAVLDLVARLAAKSMLDRFPGRRADGGARYRLLETVRQFVAERLEASGELPAVRERHAHHFLARAELAAPHLESGERDHWIARLADDQDNLRAALGWAAEDPAARRDLGLRLAAALLWFWYHRGAWSEGRSWLQASLAPDLSSPPVEPRPERAAAFAALGFLDFVAGDYAEAERRLRASAASYPTSGYEPGRAFALSFLSQVQVARGDLTAAPAAADEAVALARAAGDDWKLAMTLNNLGLVTRERGDLAGSRPLFAASARGFRRLGDAWGQAMARRNLGIVAFRCGRHREAARRFQESVAALRDLGERYFISRGLEELAGAIARLGDYARAARLFGAAEALREAIGAAVVSFYRAGIEEGVAAARAGLLAAEFAAAWAEGRAMSLNRAVEEALGDLPDTPAAPASGGRKPGRGRPSPPLREGEGSGE